LRAKHLIPFDAFEDIPEGSPGDDKEEKPFLWCPHNQHETAFRSPWTNFFYSVEKSAGGVEDIRIYERECPPEEQDLRDLEGVANEVWEAYVHMYYGKEAIGSVYLKPRGENTTNSGGSSSSSFEGLFGVKKAAGNGTDTGNGTGSWDSVHLVKVEEPNEQDKTCEYHVESAVSMSLGLMEKSDISASLTKETNKTLRVRYAPSLHGHHHHHLLAASHLENIGKIIEDAEIDFRSKLERVHLPSTMEVIESIYRKQHSSATAHLIHLGGGGSGGDGHDPKITMHTGMGIGAGMIGEIASKAKAKTSSGGGAMGGAGGGSNSFMEAMKANLAKKAATTKDADGTAGGQYNDLRSGLKKRSPPPPEGKPPTGLDLKKPLKKAASPPEQHTSPIPSPAMLDLKKTLKKTMASPKVPHKEAASTPEFMDFRSKLKKSGPKP
jgi:hypothetical protein